MSDNFPPEGDETPVDYSGLIIVAILAPVFFLFSHFDKPDMGLGVVISLGMSILAIRLRWKLRSHIWFWATIAAVMAFQVPLLSIVRWPHGKGPTLLYTMPIGFAVLGITMGAIKLAERLFAGGPSSEDNQENDSSM